MTKFKLARRCRTAVLMAAAIVMPAAWTGAAETEPKTTPAARANLKGKEFYLWGAFEIDGDPKTQAEEQKYVRSLLWKNDADIARAVTRDVDFVVIGRKPSRPVPPGKGADPIERELYRVRLRAWENSDRDLRLARKRAKELSIEVLEHDRFLKLIGAEASYLDPKAVALRRLEVRIERLVLEEVPLADVLAYLRELTRLNIVVVRPKPAAKGAAPDMRVTAELKNVTASKALRLILQVAGKGEMEFVLDSGGIVLISTKAGLARLLPRPPREWLAGSKPTRADEAVIRKLNQRIHKLDLVRVTLADVLKLLRDLTDLDPQRKWPAQARAAGADTATAVTLQLANVPAGRCMELVLVRHGLEFIIDKGAVVIRRRARANRPNRRARRTTSQPSARLSCAAGRTTPGGLASWGP